MSDGSRPTNRLAAETSAYLRQHMHNPVDWHPWGEEALERARAEDRPLLVSIGYSACHWCHVMERESFEDDDTAALMNALFVCVKVDREERPDIDQIYMDTIVRLSGHGGWPLTVFCRPDGSPFHAGTYYPPEPRHGLPAFRQVLEAAHRAYDEQRERVDDMAERILAALAETPEGEATGSPGPDEAVAACRSLMQNADREHGGFGQAPKFPTPTNLDLLLAAAPLLPKAEAEEVRNFVVFTCRQMARRGCYDQLGGGWHRYCVDSHWGVPHFEKMLYDQGPLMRVHAEAFRQTGESDLWWPVRETARWLEREMRGPEGGLYASQDADSEGVEGKFYAFTPSEIDAVLGGDGQAFRDAYGVSEAGNFEGSNVLWDVAGGPRSDFAAERAALLAAREARTPPGTDTKRVAAWNGLSVSGLALAASLTEDASLLAAAQRTAAFACEVLRRPEGGWFRIFAEGQTKVPAFLDDLAALLGGFLDLYRADPDARWLEAARAIADEIQTRFFDVEEGDLFLTPADGEPLVHRPRSDNDGATPHSCGLAVLGLLRVASLCGRDDLQETAERVIRTHTFATQRAGAAYPTLLRAALLASRGASVAVVVGPVASDRTASLAAAARQALAPEDAIVVAAPGQIPDGVDPAWLAERTPAAGDAAVWVCRGTTCSLPTGDPASIAPLPA